MGFISHHEIERKLICYRVQAVIMCEFCVGNVISPRSGIVSAEDPEIYT